MTIMQTKSEKEIREAVKEIFGAKNAKVKRNGEVHVRGIMPNTNQYGWYLLGFTGTVELDNKLFWEFWEDGSIRG